MLRKSLLLAVCLLLVACGGKTVTNVSSEPDAAGNPYYYVTTEGANGPVKNRVTLEVYNEVYGSYTKLSLGQYLECEFSKSVESKLIDDVTCTVESWEVE